MSYRTYIDGTQIFGNNDWYEEWADFLRSHDIEIDEDGCYEGEIDDVMGMFEVIDRITKKIIRERHEKVLRGEKNWRNEPYKEMTDLSDSIYLDDTTPILTFNQQMIENAYCFLPYQVYLAVKDKITPNRKCYKSGETDWFLCTYELKDGEKIKVSAY